MYVLVTYKNEEDQMKNEWTRQSWGRLHANVIDYNYNYFEISCLLITITFLKCNRLQLQITLQSNHDYFMITFDQ